MQILKCDALETPHQSVVLYGRPGMGKTTLIGSLPGRTLIVDVDRGTSVLGGTGSKADCVRLKEDLSDLPLVLAELEKNCPYDTVAIDSLSELEKSMLTVLGRRGNNSGAPELQHYNQIQFKISDYVRRFRALPCNTIFTAWEGATEGTASDGSKFQIFRPQLSGKTSDIVCGLCDTVGRIVINPQNGERIVQLQSTNYALAKDRIHKRAMCAFDEIFISSKPKKEKK